MMELQLKNLSYTYPNQNSVFNDLNHVFEKGKLTIITGKNGCGKSTLLKLMAGLIAPSNGHALLNNQELSTIVPQQGFNTSHISLKISGTSLLLKPEENN